MGGIELSYIVFLCKKSNNKNHYYFIYYYLEPVE